MSRIIRGSIIQPIYDPLDRGLVGDWRLDDIFNPNARDNHGFGNHGQLEGGADWVTSEWGPVVRFNANTELIRVPDSPSLTLTNAVTLETLFRLDATPSSDWARLISKGQGAGSDDYAISISANRQFAVRINTEAGVSTSSSGVDDVTPGVWYHYISTWDNVLNTAANAFVNGAPLDYSALNPANAGTLDATGDDLGIGRHQSSNTRHLTGQIAIARVYNRFFTEREARERYQIVRKRMQTFGGERLFPRGFVAAEEERTPRNPAYIYQIPAIV